MSNLIFVAQFIASKAGKDGLSPTWNVERITRSDGTRTALVTAGATNIAITRNGQYGYLLTGADLTLYAYTATAITTDATVDQKEMAAMADIVEADAVKIAGAATAVPGAEGGLPILSAALATSANVTMLAGETEPLDNLVLALGTGGLVEKLNSMLEAAGLDYRFTAEALAEAPTESGSGTGTYTDTILDGATPLDGVRVQLSTDAAGAHRVYEAFTNALGVFVMNPDPGTYYRWLDFAGYDFAQGVAVVVT